MNDERLTINDKHMQIALMLARRGLGQTWPNPTVGCVIVKNGEIIARARTANGGRPHAETIALEMAAENAAGATIYVTLEPCAHYGKTPPCAEALVRARVAEVIIGCLDNDPRVSGKGVSILEDAGIKVTIGVLENECRAINAGFFKRNEKHLPYVILKAAISADGKYLPGNGQPVWVTGELARRQTHLLRSQCDAVITGTGTIIADDPRLDCRLSGLEEFSPVKVVIGNTPIPTSARIFNGKEVWHFESAKLIQILKILAERGLTRVLVEAGPKLSAAFLADDLVDEVIIFQSPEKLGENGINFFAKTNFTKWPLYETEIGDDKIRTYKMENNR